MCEEFDSIWQGCQQTVRKLAEKTEQVREAGKSDKLISGQEYMQTYQKIYSLCCVHNSNNPEKLYKKFTGILNEYLIEMARHLKTAQQVFVLKQFRSIWNCYKVFLRPVKNLFAYLDKFYVPNNSLMPLEKKGLSLYCECMLDADHFSNIQDIYMREVDKIRGTEDFSSALVLKEFVDIFKEASGTFRVCQKNFGNIEKRYVDCAGQYYRKKFKELEKLACGEYLQSIEALYKKEVNLFDKCFGIASTLALLNNRFSDQLVRRFKPCLLQKATGLVWMLQNQQSDSLRLLNDIYRRLDNFNDLKERFAQYIQKNMKEFLERKKQELEVESPTSPQAKLKCQMAFMRQIFKFHKDQQKLLEDCFPGNSQFSMSYKYAMEKVLNTCSKLYNVSEVLALYTDAVIRDKKLDQPGFEDEMKHILSIFTCLIDKDVFLHHYTTFLAKRLLNQSYSNLDYETTFKSKLKQHCGVVYVQPIDNLLSDYSVCRKQSQLFSKYLLNKHKRQDFTVRLLSKGVWPNQQALQIPLFSKLITLNNIFTEYFEEHYKFKKFKWSPMESRVVFTYFLDDSLKSNCKYEESFLNMNGLQAALLFFIYERRAECVVGESLLKETFKVKPELLVGSLKQLCGKTHNVIVSSKNLQNGQNLYEFNQKMVPKRKNIVYESYVKFDDKGREQEVQNDRSMAVQMAIVKIMKTRKRLKFQNLIDEVAQLLRNFHPSIKLIKESIEKMVQKDYLQRDPKDFTQYRYKE